MTISNDQLIELTAALRPTPMQQMIMPVLLTAGIALVAFFNSNVTDVAKLQVQMEILSKVVGSMDRKLDRAINEKFSRADAIKMAEHYQSITFLRIDDLERRVFNK